MMWAHWPSMQGRRPVRGAAEKRPPFHFEQQALAGMARVERGPYGGHAPAVCEGVAAQFGVADAQSDLCPRLPPAFNDHPGGVHDETAEVRFLEGQAGVVRLDVFPPGPDAPVHDTVTVQNGSALHGMQVLRPKLLTERSEPPEKGMLGETGLLARRGFHADDEDIHRPPKQGKQKDDGQKSKFSLCRKAAKA